MPKDTRISYHGLNRRVARKLGISDALVSMVRRKSVPDRQNILATLRRERALMRAEQPGGDNNASRLSS